MDRVIEIPKWDGSEEMQPAWADTFDAAHNRVRPHIRCNCGKVTNIGNHHIHADGTITASYYHYYQDRPPKMQGCGWHVFLRMVGWTGGELLPGQDKCR
jgi:hypothetical protein